MSVNRYKPHLLVLPEDKADSALVNGFLLHPQLNVRSIQVLKPAGGRDEVVEEFIENHVPKMRQYQHTWFVLLIDFDRRQNYLWDVKKQIPDNVKDRVFILGISSNPEKLKSSLGHKRLEEIGESLADNCSNNSEGLWGHDLLKHNKAELQRMTKTVKPFLFDCGG